MSYEFPHYSMIFSISYLISPTSDYHCQLFVVRTHCERHSISRGGYSLASLVTRTVRIAPPLEQDHSQILSISLFSSRPTVCVV
jgi:hypothetical protein